MLRRHGDDSPPLLACSGGEATELTGGGTTDFSAQLIASVAPEVNTTFPPAGMPEATCSRATSIAAAPSRPQRFGLCGLANRSSHGSIAERTSGASGVVAW